MAATLKADGVIGLDFHRNGRDAAARRLEENPRGNVPKAPGVIAVDDVGPALVQQFQCVAQ